MQSYKNINYWFSLHNNEFSNIRKHKAMPGLKQDYPSTIYDFLIIDIVNVTNQEEKDEPCIHFNNQLYYLENYYITKKQTPPETFVKAIDSRNFYFVPKMYFPKFCGSIFGVKYYNVDPYAEDPFITDFTTSYKINSSLRYLWDTRTNQEHYYFTWLYMLTEQARFCLDEILIPDIQNNKELLRHLQNELFSYARINNIVKPEYSKKGKYILPKGMLFNDSASPYTINNTIDILDLLLYEMHSIRSNYHMIALNNIYGSEKLIKMKNNVPSFYPSSSE